MAAPHSSKKQIHPFKEPARIDPYRSQSKEAGTSRCPICSSLSFRGRWLSKDQARLKRTKLPPVASLLKCPACRQLEERFALGVVEVRGESWKEKLELINNMVKNTEAQARGRNDQERILWTKDEEGVRKIYVTLPELARRIGRELEKSFQGVAEYEHSSEESYLRVRWWSDLPHMGHQLGAPFAIKRKSKAPEAPGPKSRAFRCRGYV